MPEPIEKVRRRHRHRHPPTNLIIKGNKRGAEEIVENQVVSNKKRKTVDDTFGGVSQPTVDTMTPKKKKKKRDRKKKNKQEKMPVTESSCESSSSDKEEEPKKPVVAETKIVAATKKDGTSGESESKDSPDEEVENRSVAPAPVKKKGESSDDCDPPEFFSSKEPSVLPTSEKPEPKKPVEAETKNVITKKTYEPRSPFPPPPGGSKLVYMGNLNPSVQESDVVEFFKDAGKIDWVRFTRGNRILGFAHVRFDTSEAAQKALKRNGEELIGRAVKLILSDERSIFDMFTPSSEYQYLFMGNLHPDVKESDIIEFFKDAGKVVSVHLSKQGGHFLGYGNVKFASSTVAHKAVRRNGHMLLGRRVELVLATERTVWFSYTPSSGRRRRRVMIDPGRGPTKNEPRCQCTPPESVVSRVPGVSERKNNRSRCRSCLRLNGLTYEV